MIDERYESFGGFELPPEGWGKYQVIDVRFDLTKDKTKPLMVVESEYIEEGPDNGTKLITYNSYTETFVLVRVKSLMKRCLGREPEDTPARPLVRSLADEGFRQVVKQNLIGKRFGALVKHEITQRGGQLPKVTGYTSFELVDTLRAEEQAKANKATSVTSTIPQGLAGLL